jgi:hypothetical protein
MRLHRALVPVLAALLFIGITDVATAQPDLTGSRPLNINVNKLHFQLHPAHGDGGMANQFSWNLVARHQNSEPFFYPADRWYSNMLFQIWNFPNLDDHGYVDQHGNRQERVWRIQASTTDWSWERRRYRPPEVTVDGLLVTPPYVGDVDPDLPADYVGVFEDVLRNPDTGYGGIRSRVELYAFSNPNHQDYLIWKETRKFTGERLIPREIGDAPTRDMYLPDQSVRLWWSYTMGFGPTKGGERSAWGYFLYESEDSKENWFRRPSTLVPHRDRSDLTVAYFWDDTNAQQPPYVVGTPDGGTREATDTAGDPNRLNGGLQSTQIPGFTILHADRSADDRRDDPAQPMASPRGAIPNQMWGNQGNFAMRDYWAGLMNPWPGPTGVSQKGSIRSLTVGPYELSMARTDDGDLVRSDSFTVVYAIGVGDVGHRVADSLGRAWFRGEVTDQEKRSFIEMGRDSLFNVLDKANWAWANDLNVPAPPPPPDIEVTSGPGHNLVAWSYPESRYWLDAHTGVNDFHSWRVYRKEGARFVNDPADHFQGKQWELVHEILNQNEVTWEDRNVERGVSYYYAVTAMDDGSQNTFGLHPGQRLESSRYANMTRMPAIPFEAGLAVSDQVRVVPNPATQAAAALAFPGSPNKILFANLPYEATLSIYTEGGDLVTRIDHVGTADKEWYQLNDANQYVASGIYILAVHNARDLEGRRLPDHFVKFVIVR